ncbi:trichohyalin-like isoform X2 [Acanthopagrus latus]|uniref:trichohyalin-like isoform X2 n=1 Tax=Acanthopagrus latus TaxID=8177 RepID=UPI00187C8A26|nr:trichohyalin-like isoform X2 [Acanthopagrus latus]
MEINQYVNSPAGDRRAGEQQRGNSPSGRSKILLFVGLSFGLLCIVQTAINVSVQLQAVQCSNSSDHDSTSNITRMSDSDIRDLISERDQLLRDKDQLKQGKDQLLQERDQLLRDKNKLKEDKYQLVRRRDQLLNQRDRLVREKDQLKQQTDQLKCEKDQLKEEKDQLKEEKDRLLQENNQLNQDKDQLRREKDQLLHQRVHLVQENNQLKRQTDQMKCEKDQLIREKDQLKQEKDQLLQENNRLNHDKDQLIKEKDRLLQENNQLNQEKDQLLHQRDHLVQENNRLKRQTNQMKCEKDQLLHQRDHLVQENNRLKREKTQLIEDNRMLNETICKQQTERNTPSCPPGWRSYKSACYLLSPETNTWDYAKHDCETKGAHLVVFNNEAEEQAVVSTFGCSLEMWMGLRKRQDLLTCNWMLEDGSQLHYTNWNNPLYQLHPCEYCAYADKGSSSWNNWFLGSCQHQHFWMCEMQQRNICS